MLSIDDTVDEFEERLEKTSPSMRSLLDPYIKEIRSTLQFAQLSGVTRPVQIDPLLLGHRNSYFANGVCYMAVRKTKRTDVLAAGGRYAYRVLFSSRESLTLGLATTMLSDDSRLPLPIQS